jgi:hypothetical protein
MHIKYVICAENDLSYHGRLRRAVLRGFARLADIRRAVLRGLARLADIWRAVLRGLTRLANTRRAVLHGLARLPDIRRAGLSRLTRLADICRAVLRGLAEPCYADSPTLDKGHFREKCDSPRQIRASNARVLQIWREWPFLSLKFKKISLDVKKSVRFFFPIDRTINQ